MGKILKTIDQNEDNELLCKRCGRCCLEQRKLGRYYKLTGNACKQLRRDEKGKAYCKTYHLPIAERKQSKGRCETAEHGVKAGIMPNKCPYVKLYKKGYRSKVIDWRFK